MKYRKKPVIIEAIEYWGDDVAVQLFANPGTKLYPGDIPGTIKIGTLEGVMMASKGDFIIKGIKGELYLCKPDIFKDTYELFE
ncbi:MAG: hypothetical protein HC773_01325 [Scytonema sp. CRU_2_7]|nr:hypothetical protein [Scytonema sp. CRU_2_7]